MKFLVVGLGNAGNEYAHTRHNIGFDVAAAFVARHGGSFRSDRLAHVADVKWKGKQFCCILPTTFMNLSGKAVRYWMDKERIDIANILVIVDDLAIPVDKLRVRPGGSDAGHNGLKSIQEILGTTEYPRFRFGIGADYPKGMQADFVLGKWRPEEEPVVKLKIDACVEGITVFASQGVTAAMNLLNNKRFSL
ncbi:MAG: aminoacyl-tRNA hydrolase [Chitinophagaceae bacterium]|nr:MAG: aminoacyl-tRNA hydrolase [Chitinophagaceae bacterium]